MVRHAEANKKLEPMHAQLLRLFVKTKKLEQDTPLGTEVGCGPLCCVLFVFSNRLCCCSCPCSYDSLLCAPVDCNGRTPP